MKASLLFSLLLLSGYCAQAQLQRRIMLGAALEFVSDGRGSGCVVKELRGGTSEALKLQVNDLIIKIGESSFSSSEGLTKLLHTYAPNQKIEVTVLRGTKTHILTAKAAPRPLETDDNASVIYDDADYRGGKLRVIINKPLGDKKMPAMLFIPGYTCTSIDGLSNDHPYKRIIDAYVDAGYVTLRIEKSGLGDNRNTPGCESCDLQDEIENFEVGLKKLKTLTYIDTNKIIIFGHSMGGVIAPAISARYQVAGVIVYGTTAKSWFEYKLELNRIQNKLSGLNPLEVEQSVVEEYEANYRFYIKKESLVAMAKDPVIDTILRTRWEYDGNNNIYGRNAEYWRQIQSYPHLENWKNTKARVLVQFGESDFQAFSREDHEQIVNVVNHFHPGNATLKTFPLTDHFFARSGTMQEAYNKYAKGGIQTLFNEYNNDVGLSAVLWSNNILNNKNEAEAQLKPWRKLKTEAYRGKQDDITFIDEQQGWYVNGYGNIYHTSDGGETWQKQLEKKGTFFRCIAFVDSLRGFAGTVGTDYFPNVSDTIPLYGTIDGGKTWTAVPYDGPYVKGLCALEIVREQFINHGQTDYKVHLFGVGRVGAPANMMVSHDGGITWSSKSMDDNCKMLFDITMLDKNTGFACAASDQDVSQSNALILKTADGGKTWKKVYQSQRPFETTWKASFPTHTTGYVTIQSYNPDPTVKQQRVAKTTDGGETWSEMNLVEDAQAREFGVGFVDENHGFVGTMKSGYETKDGGLHWTPVDLGMACNKIRIYKGKNGKAYGYAIGVDVLRGDFGK